MYDLPKGEVIGWAHLFVFECLHNADAAIQQAIDEEGCSPIFASLLYG